MPTPAEEDELEQTKMSFGEHLEELRRALFKSLLALLVGFLVGLCIGIPLVDFIQEPLRKGLAAYYQTRDETELQQSFDQQAAAGQPVPEDRQAAALEMVRRGFAPHDAYVLQQDLADALAARFPEFAESLESSAPTTPAESDDSVAAAVDAPPGAIRLRFYQHVQDDARLNAIATNAYEPFLVYIKASFAAGLVLASPFIFYYIWMFVAAGLYRSEKQYVHIYLPASLGLFLVGAGIAYFFAFEYVLQFLFWFHEKMGIDPYPKLSDWITTVVLLPLGFGVSFQLPLVMLLLERIGVFSVDAYLKKWRIAVVIIAVMAMVLTPGGDIQSMMLMFVPLTGLYFLGILLCKYMPGGSLRSPLRDLPHRTKSPEPSKPQESAPPKPAEPEPSRPEENAGA